MNKTFSFECPFQFTTTGNGPGLHTNICHNNDSTTSTEFLEVLTNFGIEDKSTTAVFLVVTTVCLVSLLVTKRYFSDDIFDGLQGPKGIWPLGIAYKLWSCEERMSSFTSWVLDYKPYCAIRIASLKLVFLTTTDAAQKLLLSPNSGHLNKGFGYEAFIPFLRNGLVLSNVETWKERRRLLAKAFTVRSVMGYMQVFNKQSKSLVEELTKISTSWEDGNNAPSRIGQPIDGLLYNHALRTICEATMGTEIWDIEGSDTLTSFLNESNDICMMRMLQPWLLKNWVWNWHPKSTYLKLAVAKFDEFTCKVIERRKQHLRTPDQLSEDDDLASGMKRAFTSITEEMIMAGFDDESVIEEVNTFIATGYETAATTLHFFLFCMASNAKHQEMCREEVDQVFEDVSLCPNGDLVYEALANLKYLERCLYETLRLFPPTPLFYRRLEAPLQLDEKTTLPPGVNVGVFSPGIHRDPNYYPNPDTFDPDNFLPEKVKERGQHAFLPFSSGSRNCIGSKFGINEVKVMMARILRHFKIETTDTVESVPLCLELTLTTARGYNFILTRRR